MATVRERLEELGELDREMGMEDTFSYSWDHGYEDLRVKPKEYGGLTYGGQFHPGDGCCKGNPCEFCGKAFIE